MKTDRLTRLVRWACGLSLVSLALMAWALLHPHPLAVVAAMTAGQGIGTIAFVLYGFAVLLDLRKAKVLRGQSSSDTPPSP